MLKGMISLVLISIGIYFAIAFGLILSQWPSDLAGHETISFSSVENDNGSTSAAKLQTYVARDGSKLGVRHFPAKTPEAPLFVFVHGSGWHGGGYVDLAQQIAASGKVEVLLPDLRGHGPNPARRGDVDYIGQFEDDIADLISQYRKDGQEVILAGHSSGGGITIRFAGGKHRHLIDRAVLMAPFLKHDAPTARENAGGWAHPLTRRFIGLHMLNMARIPFFNGITAIQFKFPENILASSQGYTATTAYSYRLNASYAPRDNYFADIAALPRFLLLVGDREDAFIAEAYEPTMAAITDKGSYQILPGVDHIGLGNSPLAAEAILQFLNEKE